MNKIVIFFDGKEYFKFKSVVGQHNIDQNLAFKSINANAILSEPFKDFLITLETQKIMLAQVFINDKLFITGHVNNACLDYRDTATGGTEISVAINDRFIGLRKSEIIKTQPKGSLPSFIQNVMHELQFDGPFYINTYGRKIVTTADFISVQNGISPQSLKAFEKKNFVQDSSAQLIEKMCSFAKVFLISNGSDVLALETPNGFPQSVFSILRQNNIANIDFCEKQGSRAGIFNPSKIVILNTNRQSKKDEYSSVVTYNDYGLPHIQAVNNISLEASYQEINSAVNFGIAGIQARINTFIYKIPNTIFDSNGNFFQPNRVVKVFDDKFGIDEPMTILQANFTIDSQMGSSTSLNLTSQNSLINNGNVKQKRTLMRK